MRTKIHSSNLRLSITVKQRIQRRLGFALGRFGDVIRRIDVRVSDANGPRGGEDKLCRIRVQLWNHHSPIIAEVLHQELLAAVSLAADRAGRTAMGHANQPRN